METLNKINEIMDQLNSLNLLGKEISGMMSRLDVDIERLNQVINNLEEKREVRKGSSIFSDDDDDDSIFKKE